MLTIAEKSAIFAAVKRSYLISGKTFNPSVIYSGQPDFSYPVINLNYIDEGGYSQQAVGNIITSTGTTGQRSVAHLSISVEVKADSTAQSLNKNTLAEQICLDLYQDIKTNWTSLNSGSVKAGELSKVRNLTSVYQALQINNIAKYQFDVELFYDISW